MISYWGFPANHENACSLNGKIFSRSHIAMKYNLRPILTPVKYTENSIKIGRAVSEKCDHNTVTRDFCILDYSWTCQMT